MLPVRVLYIPSVSSYFGLYGPAAPLPVPYAIGSPEAHIKPFKALIRGSFFIYPPFPLYALIPLVYIIGRKNFFKKAEPFLILKQSYKL